MRRRRRPLAERIAHERAVAEAFMIASALVDAAEADRPVMTFEEARRTTLAEFDELVRARPELATKLPRST
jgi:hypothetical protein